MPAMKKLLMLGCMLAYGTAVAAPSGTARCDKLLDVKTGKILDDQAISFSKGVVTSVGPAAALPADAHPISVHGTCLPGLIDAHVHLTSDPVHAGYQGLGVSIPRQAVLGVKNARLTLQAGFTTVRNVGAMGFADVALRDGVNAGDVDGPRMQVSGPALGITGGHVDNNLLPYEYHVTNMGVADGPWEAVTRVREVIKYGADLIKIAASGGVLSKGDLPGTPQYTLEEMQAIVTEAHREGRRVASHAHGTQSIKDSILAGVDSVEHASLIDDEGIQLAKDRGTWLVMDIYNDDYILSEGLKAGMLPESIEKEKTLGRTQRENFRRAHAAGVKMAFGTDAGVYPHGDNAKQFAKMVEWGMTPLESIQAATLNAAELMGWSGKVGVLAPGAYADMIAVPGNPLQDVHTLEHVAFVMQGGAVKKDTQGNGAVTQ
jgi:imidazolonepropionase-like amidohydrolase